ncbi:hypothetical protein LX59_02796 [Azomonas agilis]|uniref:Probable membrane transporter protein n=1 Tax=Azomonas agilis TaxID=116849 RepID=A0A562HZC3_9GAMM|nr:sulfite exporter TauE/SafE family protein [Azomonas agilis]TWH64119.1 hypothetical protein LX59_02796 [Azomonas agilis]
MEFVLYLLLGGLAGVLAGLFGIGGGIVIVPVLVLSFSAQGFDPCVLTHMAVGTSLASIVFTSINSILTHHRKGAVHWPVALWISVGIVFGVWLGSLTAAAIQGPMLQKIIGIFALLVAAQMAWDIQPKASLGIPSPPTLGIVGVVIGWASAIFGIGGGSLTVPYLVWRSFPIQQAVATASACGFPIALGGAMSFIGIGWSEAQLPPLSLGFVYLPALVGIALTSMYCARLGANLAHRLPPRLLKRLFAALLASVGLYFLI